MSQSLPTCFNDSVVSVSLRSAWRSRVSSEYCRTPVTVAAPARQLDLRVGEGHADRSRVLEIRLDGALLAAAEAGPDRLERRDVPMLEGARVAPQHRRARPRVRRGCPRPASRPPRVLPALSPLASAARAPAAGPGQARAAAPRAEAIPPSSATPRAASSAPLQRRERRRPPHAAVSRALPAGGALMPRRWRRASRRRPCARPRRQVVRDLRHRARCAPVFPRR